MKSTPVSLLLAAILLLVSTHPAAAYTNPDVDFENTGAAAADAIIVRPACLAATFVCAGLFIVSLPVAAISGSVKQTTHALILYPSRITFTRKLGDFGPME